MYDKRSTLMKETLKDANSKVKLSGELSEPFEIRIGVRQCDGIWPSLLICALEEVVRGWENC